MLFRARSLQLRQSLHLRSKSTDEDRGQESGVALHDRAMSCISLCVLSFAFTSSFLFRGFGVPVERGEETHFGAYAERARRGSFLGVSAVGLCSWRPTECMVWYGRVG